MARAMITAGLMAMVLIDQGVHAQLQVCDPKIRVGPIKAIYMKGTKNTGSTSEITVGWQRPFDGPSGSLNSCITEYIVTVYLAGTSSVFKTDKVSVTPVHTDATYTAYGLKPGASYEFYVYGRNPSLGASGNGAGLRSAAFKAALPAPAPSACGQPQQVTNIRREAATAQGNKAVMTIGWNPPQSTPASCIKEYTVNIYKAGDKQNMIKSATVQAPNTKYTDDIYEAGKQYEFYIYARNPAAGAMGNGVGVRSQPITAPVAAVAG